MLTSRAGWAMSRLPIHKPFSVLRLWLPTQSMGLVSDPSPSRKGPLVELDTSRLVKLVEQSGSPSWLTWGVMVFVNGNRDIGKTYVSEGETGFDREKRLEDRTILSVLRGLMAAWCPFVLLRSWRVLKPSDPALTITPTSTAFSLLLSLFLKPISVLETFGLFNSSLFHQPANVRTNMTSRIGAGVWLCRCCSSNAPSESSSERL